MDTIEPKKRTRVRAYPSEFKARLVAESQQPGTSVAKVALTHGLNANMLHTWRREARGKAAGAERKAEFVAAAGRARPVAWSGHPHRTASRHHKSRDGLADGGSRRLRGLDARTASVIRIKEIWLYRAQQLAVCRQPARGQARRRDHQLGALGPAEWP